MLVLDFFTWWYGRGWAGILISTKRRLLHLSRLFSITTLLNTLFAPWRRIISYPGAGLDAHMRAILDNLVSRCIGLVVRLFVLLAAGCSLVGVLVISGVELILWPFIPIAAVVLIVMGLT